MNEVAGTADGHVGTLAAWRLTSEVIDARSERRQAQSRRGQDPITNLGVRDDNK
jgi:hypothetical protein